MTKTLLVVCVGLLGCGDSAVPTDPDYNSSHPSSQLSTEGNVVKIAVHSDGTIYVNAETVEVDALASRLDELGDIKEIWYHRETPDAAEPHPNAMKTIEEIANRKLPIAMYLDETFKQPATFGK